MFSISPPWFPLSLSLYLFLSLSLFFFILLFKSIFEGDLWEIIFIEEYVQGKKNYNCVKEIYPPRPNSLPLPKNIVITKKSEDYNENNRQLSRRSLLVHI